MEYLIPLFNVLINSKRITGYRVLSESLMVISLNLLSLIYWFIKRYVLFAIRPEKKQCRVGRTEGTPIGRANSGHRLGLYHRLHCCHFHQRLPPRRPLEPREIALQGFSVGSCSSHSKRTSLRHIFFIVRILYVSK